MSVTQITDYSNFNKNPWWIERLKDSNLKEGVLESSDNQFNEIEVVLFQLYLNMWISTAVGEQLDVLGVHLDISRNGRNDTNYRSLLIAKVDANTSSGQPERVISAVKSLFGVTDVEYDPEYPAKFRLNAPVDETFQIENNLVTLAGDNLTTLAGDNLITQNDDQESLNVLSQIIPSGVGLALTDNLVFNDGSLVATDDGSEIAVSIFTF
jgi:hypothetical protein